MQESPVTIGRCVGCNKMQKLTQNACPSCLKRGTKWLELAHRVRTDSEFALACYQRIKSDKERDYFVAYYGLPEGAEPKGITLIRR